MNKLIDLIFKADHGNRKRLEQAYPAYVKAVSTYQNEGPRLLMIEVAANG